MAFIYDLTDTWNAGGTTFSAIKMNVTDTASAAASKLVQCQIGGTDKFTVGKDGGGYFAGNVGIGTSSPSAKLHAVSSSTNTVLFQGTSSKNLWSYADSQHAGWGTGTGGAGVGNYTNLMLFNDTNSYTSIYTAGSERMRIDSAGNVGIGTSSPDARLRVSGNTNSLQARFANVDGRGLAISTLSSAGTNDNGVIYNAGVFADAQHVWQCGGTERMRIDSSGNVGIGTGSPGAKLHVSDAANGKILISGTSTSAELELSAPIPKITFTDTSGSAADGEIKVDGNAMQIAMNSTERMRIDSSGNVGIGTSSPTFKLDVAGNARASYFALRSNEAAPAETAFVYRPATGNLAFGTASTERMRITSFGELALGCTSSQENATSGASGHFIRPTSYPIFAADSSIALLLNRTGSDGQIAQFRKAGSTVGFISVTSSATTYNTSSDYRLKDIDGPITGSGAYIDALKPVQGSWKADGSRFIGLLAHEVQEVSETQIATGEKDGEEMQAMDYSAPELIANLIAEIQSLRARVAQLEG